MNIMKIMEEIEKIKEVITNAVPIVFKILVMFVVMLFIYAVFNFTFEKLGIFNHRPKEIVFKVYRY